MLGWLVGACARASVRPQVQVVTWEHAGLMYKHLRRAWINVLLRKALGIPIAAAMKVPASNGMQSVGWLVGMTWNARSVNVRDSRRFCVCCLSFFLVIVFGSEVISAECPQTTSNAPPR